MKHSPCYSTATSSQACRGAGGNSPGSLHVHAPSRSTNTNPLLPEPSGPHPAWHLLAELRPRRVSPAASGEPRAGEEARGCTAPSDAEVPRDGLAGAAPTLLTCFGDVSGKLVQSRPHEALEMPPPCSQGGICKLPRWKRSPVRRHKQALQRDAQKAHGKPEQLNPVPPWGPILISNCSASAWMQNV